MGASAMQYYYYYPAYNYQSLPLMVRHVYPTHYNYQSLPSVLPDHFDSFQHDNFPYVRHRTQYVPEYYRTFGYDTNNIDYKDIKNLLLIDPNSEQWSRLYDLHDGQS